MIKTVVLPLPKSILAYAIIVANSENEVIKKSSSENKFFFFVKDTPDKVPF